MLSKIFESSYTGINQMYKLHILKLNTVTGKLIVKSTNVYLVDDYSVIIPDLSTTLQLKLYESEFGRFYTQSIYDKDSDTLSIFVLDMFNLNSYEKFIHQLSKKQCLQVYKNMVIHTLKYYIYKSTELFNKTNSIELGEEINCLIDIMTKYEKA